MVVIAGTQARAVERRADILEAACGLLASGGTAAVTHRQVAEKAGVPNGSIRYYFATRDALLRACVEDIEARRDAEAQRALAEASADPDRPSAEVTAQRMLRVITGKGLGDEELRGTLCWLVDTTRENAELATVLAEERVRLEAQARELLRLSGFTTIPAELVISLGEGVMFKLHVENRSGIARETVAAMAELLSYRRD
ncbi:TetR/AcrR family transcriptional regulator [Kocuria rhizophila]|uniref:TetR/AcrR family transcriptional regulator n=1 Tax=Kocuria rhizophila TaxID=72000 RepID=UPI0021A7985C|nr:TetR family transcriptional regulator [Kocuria rhizophila]MCT1916732.1 TetR family transcriptional regulator [Kocuria rhizophila]